MKVFRRWGQNLTPCVQIVNQDVDWWKTPTLLPFPKLRLLVEDFAIYL